MKGKKESGFNIESLSDVIAEKLSGYEYLEDALRIVDTGIKFTKSQVGRRAGPFQKSVQQCALRCLDKGEMITFNNLLFELDLMACEREELGEQHSIIEKVDRTWELVTYHHPSNGRKQLTFKALRSHLTKAKKTIDQDIL